MSGMYGNISGTLGGNMRGNVNENLIDQTTVKGKQSVLSLTHQR
jgi:hypothetical protein